jgi:hypothetical protein
MEILAPAIVGLGYLYIVSNQSKNGNSQLNEETFRNKIEKLPNIDVPNKNFPDETVNNVETDLTSSLSTNNTFNTGKNGVYTDKYFNESMNMTNNSFVGGSSSSSSSNGQQYTSLTGQSVDIDYYRHNNMQPFFGTKSHTGGKIDALESTLDSYQGSGSQHISKKEIAPMFEPGTNTHYAFGTPNQTDFIKSRINPSLKMSNVKPFEEIKVGPGIGLGYGQEGIGGYNSGMLGRELWQDKTVDELRVNNKLKASGLSSLGFEGPAYSHIKERGELGIQEKNRVDASFELGQNRLFTTTGIVKAPTLRSIENDRETSRQFTTQEYAGGASTSSNIEYVKGEFMEPHMQQLGQYQMTPAYASNKGESNENDYSAKSYNSYSNNRTYSNNNDYYGVVKSSIGATIAPLLDILRPSRKENVIGTLRPYQNPKSTVENSYIFNPNDTLPTTIRQTTENSKYHLNVNKNQNGGAYKTTPQQPIHNERDTTTDFYYAGVGSANERGRQPRTYDAEYRQRNNDIKSSTIDGRLVPGNMALMNGDINVKTNENRDTMLQNNRSVNGLIHSYSQVPSTDTFGKLQGTTTSNSLFQGQQLERNNGDVLKQLKGNPYTQNILNIL